MRSLASTFSEWHTWAHRKGQKLSASKAGQQRLLRRGLAAFDEVLAEGRDQRADAFRTHLQTSRVWQQWRTYATAGAEKRAGLQRAALLAFGSCLRRGWAGWRLRVAACHRKSAAATQAKHRALHSALRHWHQVAMLRAAIEARGRQLQITVVSKQQRAALHRWRVMAHVRSLLRQRYGGSPLRVWRHHADDKARLRRLGAGAVQRLLAATLSCAWHAWRAAVKEGQEARAAAQRAAAADSLWAVIQARRARQNVRLAWRAWKLSAQLHHLVDRYCGLAARSGSAGGGRATAALSLVLCPCALHALEHRQPVDCNCSASAAQFPAESTDSGEPALPGPQDIWAVNPEYEQYPQEDPEEAQQLTASTDGAQCELPQPRESWASNPALVEDARQATGQDWDIIDGHIRVRCSRAPGFSRQQSHLF